MRGIQALIVAGIAAIGTAALAQDDRPAAGGPGPGPQMREHGMPPQGPRGETRQRAPRERGEQQAERLAPSEREEIDQLRKEVQGLRQQIRQGAQGQPRQRERGDDALPSDQLRERVKERVRERIQQRLGEGPPADGPRGQSFRRPQRDGDQRPALRRFQGGKDDRFNRRVERFKQFRHRQGPPRGDLGPGTGPGADFGGRWQQQPPRSFEFFRQDRDGASGLGGPRQGRPPMPPVRGMMERDGGGHAPFREFGEDGPMPRFGDMAPREREEIRREFRGRLERDDHMRGRDDRNDDDKDRKAPRNDQPRRGRPAPRGDHER